MSFADAKDATNNRPESGTAKIDFIMGFFLVYLVDTEQSVIVCRKRLINNHIFGHFWVLVVLIGVLVT